MIFPYFFQKKIHFCDRIYFTSFNINGSDVTGKCTLGPHPSKGTFCITTIVRKRAGKWRFLLWRHLRLWRHFRSRDWRHFRSRHIVWNKYTVTTSPKGRSRQYNVLFAWKYWIELCIVFKDVKYTDTVLHNSISLPSEILYDPLIIIWVWIHI